MEWVYKAAWVALAAVHAAPAAAVFRPQLIEALYGAKPDGDVGLLLVHRGALFLAVVAASLSAVFVERARVGAAIVVSISVIGFLFVYVGAGAPAGPLRKIAVADLAALVPLALAIISAARPIASKG